MFWEKGVDRRSIEIVSEAIQNLRRITSSNVKIVLYGTVDVYEFLVRLSIEKQKKDLNPTIVVSRRHIRTRETNFLFGLTFPETATILSTHHFMKSYGKNWELPFLLITYHEIGHLFGAPRSNRTDLEDLIGKHCKNRNCAMEQVNVNGKLDALEKVKYVDLDSPYCNQCLEDIRIGITSWKKLKEKLKASDGRDELQS